MSSMNSHIPTMNLDNFPISSIPFLPSTQPQQPPPSSSSERNHSHNKRNYANLRLNIRNNNKKHAKSSSSKARQRSATAISHATRIEPTNFSYKDLLRKHQFTPSAGSCSASPIKQSFDNIALNDDSNANEYKVNNVNNGALENERAAFLKRPIIEEPKKSVSAYQLFAKYVRSERPHTLQSGCSQSKAISVLWTNLAENEKNEWIKKSEYEKIQYHNEKEEWLAYVNEAKRLGLNVPTKSVKPLIQQIKIKNLMNIIPKINGFNKETAFIISKATECFIQFYASKCLQISPSNHTISAQHCFDALRTEHKFNFLRAVTVKPHRQNHKSTKRKKSVIGNKRKRSFKNNEVKKEANKRKKVSNDKNKKESDFMNNGATNQIITNHDFPSIVSPQTTQSQQQQSIGGYSPFMPSNYYFNSSQPPPSSQQTPFASTLSPNGGMYQAPSPFHSNSFYGTHRVNVSSQSSTKQLDVGQIFGSDD